MNILIELPTWLGDAVMTTPSIENIMSYYNDSKITLLGSLVATDVVKSHPKINRAYALEYKYRNLYKTAKKLGDFDLFLSYRGSMRARCMKFFVSANMKYQYDKNKYNDGHQVEKYNNFVNDCLGINTNPGKLIVHNQNKSMYSNKKLLGLNPGASYGSAKRWYPEEFANLAFNLSTDYDVIIFGGADEIDIAFDIEKYLIEKGVNNYKNLAGQTSIKELVNQIANLDLFITGDSGPMHVASALQIPTISIFGPTNDRTTSQWANEKSVIIKKKLECQPCLKRKCPLHHHNCMKKIKAIEVLDSVRLIV